MKTKKVEAKKIATKKVVSKKKFAKTKNLDFSFSLVGKYVGKDEYNMIVSKHGNVVALSIGLGQLILEKKDFRQILLLAIKYAQRATKPKSPITKVNKAKVQPKKKKK
jgi:hypothetical protein